MSASEPSMSSQEPSAGTRLRQARERAGLTLTEVAQRTLIPVARLQALEQDEYQQVGVATFVLGYTRTYARVLGLDPVPLVRQLEDLLSSQSPAHEPAPSVALSLEVRKRPGSVFWPLMWFFLAVLVVAAVAGISALGILDPPVSNLSPPVATAPARTPVAAPQRSTEIAIPEIRVELQDPPASEDVREPVQEQDISPQLPLDDADFASVETAAAPTEQPLPAPAAESPPAELVLSASGDCWVEVTDATGKRIIARNLASGDNLRLFGQAPFDVILGNAVAVEMTLNGQPVDTSPPVGRKMLRLTVTQ